MKTISKRVAEFIYNKRMALGLSQNDLAEMAFGDRARQDFISKVESGKRVPNLDSLERILKALKSDIKIVEH